VHYRRQISKETVFFDVVGIGSINLLPLARIDEDSACHTEKRKTKKEER
jgi:hypothetical protein